jgi:hypothetical protein
MSHRIAFELEYRIVLLSFLGIATEDSVMAGLSEPTTFIRASGMEGAIIDFSGIESSEVSINFIRNYVNSREIVARDKPRVAVAPQPAIYGVLRTYAAYAESSGVFPILVRTMTEAYGLLRLESPVFGSQPWSASPDTAARAAHSTVNGSGS